MYSKVKTKKLKLKANIATHFNLRADEMIDTEEAQELMIAVNLRRDPQVPGSETSSMPSTRGESQEQSDYGSDESSATATAELVLVEY